MDEKELLELWNEKRSQVIHAQLAPSIVLIGILALASLGTFVTASDEVQYLAIFIAAGSGILSIISQFAAIREAEALVRELSKLESKTLLARKVADSGLLLKLTTFATLAIGLATFYFVVLAVMA
jgi:hypothetical protein